MNPIIIPFAFSAFLLVLANRTWRMTEKKWLIHMSSWNPLGIDYSKYNQKKIRSTTIAFLLFEAICVFPIGLTFKAYPVLTKILLWGIVGGVVAYWLVLLVFCKKSKYKKRWK